jgi:NHLM bacteriocin system ABC transporter ATP-binding protein
MLAAHLRSGGILLDPRPNHAFSIHLPDVIWFVQSGKLDLFMVRTAKDGLAGARHHVLRVEQGQAIFGMCPIEGNEHALVASATPGTQLLCVSQSYLRELSRSLDPQLGADAFALLEDWIALLGVVVSAAPPPKVFIELTAGAVLEVMNEAKPVIPVNGIVWVEHLEGASCFLNRTEIDVIADRGYFPVSGHGWLQPSPQSRILSIDSREWDRIDPNWQSLQAFHHTVLQCLLRSRVIETSKEQEALWSRAKFEAATIRSALWTLASPLRDDESPDRSDEAVSSDPTLRACEAVGKRLGVRIVAPPEMRSGIRLKDPVASIARASTLRHRIVALKGNWWVNANDPLVAFRDSDNRPLALLPTSRTGYEFYDPVEQTTTPIDASIALTLNGFAYSFYRPLPNRKLSIWDLLAFGLHDLKHEIATIALMGVCAGLLAMVSPIATGMIFNTIIPSAQRTQLLQVSGFLVTSAFALSMFALTRGFATLRLEGKLGASLQAALWDRLLRLPVRFFRLYTSGDLAQRSLGIEYLLRMLTGSILSSILSGIFSVFSFFLLFYYSWRLALVASGLLLVASAASAISIRFQVRYQRQIVRLGGRISGILLQLIDNIGKLRVSGTEPRAFAVWAHEFSAQKKLSIRAQRISNRLAIFHSAFPIISLAVIFGYAAHLMGQPLLNTLTTGTFLAFMAAFIQFQSAALQLNTAVESVLGIVPIYERVTPILESLPEVDDAKKHPGELVGAIEINHLNFRYHPDGPLVLRDFSLLANPGQFVAIVGPSGSGKSTLLRLLLGFERPDSGAVYYDGQDLAGLDIQAVRRQIGVVIQNARLVSGSIFENIVGSAPLTFDDAWEVARLAGLEQDIREMPMGMHTLVAEGGANLSGGQRQRLHIARAIVKKPRIFLLDEATSSLDNQTQSVVSRSLDALQATRVVIAHRLSTIINANRILVVDKGVLVQNGSYDELMNEAGLFRELAKRQLT